MEVFVSVILVVAHLIAAVHVAYTLNYHKPPCGIFVAGILVASLNGAAAILWAFEALDNLGLV